MKLPSAQDLFSHSLQYIISILIIYIVLVLVIGLIKTISGMTVLLDGELLSKSFSRVVSDILSFLVIIELFRGFIEYFESHRFRLHSMLSPSIVFIIRELIVKLYAEESTPWKTLAAFGFLILCLGIVRSLAIRFTPEQGK